MTGRTMEAAAFEAGYRRGEQRGEASPREADAELRALGIDPTDGAVTCYCNGSDDGLDGDDFRLALGRRLAEQTGAVPAFVFRAALLCVACGVRARAELPLPAGADPADETTFDSDDWPKGPYPDGGGEADTPQHCDRCSVFLRNPLTTEGEEYVRQAIQEARGDCWREWAEYYGIRAKPADAEVREPDGPCYVVGPRDVTYEDGWCYGPGRWLGRAGDDAEARALIHADIRQAPAERNGLPLYYLSDHGNLHRTRAITLRRLAGGAS